MSKIGKFFKWLFGGARRLRRLLQRVGQKIRNAKAALKETEDLIATVRRRIADGADDVVEHAKLRELEEWLKKLLAEAERLRAKIEALKKEQKRLLDELNDLMN